MAVSKKPNIPMFEALHGLRGIAAFCVVIRHTRDVTGIDFVPGGFLAVDLFFLLSGFVICHAYENKLRGTMSFSTFAKMRLIRLYPLYILGLVLGSLYEIAKFAKFGQHAQLFTLPQLVSQFAAGLFFLPAPPTLVHIAASQQLLFPMNGPAWSLFFELMINFIYAALIYQFSRRGLAAAIALSLALLIWSMVASGTPDGGSTWSTFLVGIPRVSFSFLLGVYLRRYHTDHVPTGKSSPGRLALLGLLLVAIAVVFPADPTQAIWASLAIIIAGFPLMLLAAARIELDGIPRLLSHQAGEASYAIYVIHLPLLLWTYPVFRVLFHAQNYPLAFALGYGVAITMLGIALAPTYDAPVRKWLRQKFIPTPQVPFGPARVFPAVTDSRGVPLRSDF
jgi:peptidoglycan/LPS O-acetylase OafA/YrhL